jgi:hypothetical protein
MRNLSVGLFFAVAMSACQGGGSGATMGPEPEAVAMAPLKVDLPPPPSFAASDIPEKYPDGFFTIRGVRKQRAKTLGTEVKVRGYLLEVYQCPVCPKKQTCKACDQPHFILGDKADTKKEKALMIVDYLMPKQKPPILTVGKQYEVQGTFQRNSPTGFASSDGLLLFTHMVDDKNVEFVSPAAQLEAKAKAGEALEEAQMARAARIKASARH